MENWELASTLPETEKSSVKKLAIQFLNQHYYFGEIWKYLSNAQKTKILDIISEGKGIIPYENIVNMHYLFSTPENGIFFEKTEFFSKLKQKAVNNADYQTSFYLYKTLKMRHSGDMNGLYNVQDVILLSEICENRFQCMNDRYGFNPRKCNSASSLSGCIEREMSRVIIALPTSNEILDIFEQTITGGFSCVNNRLAFDSEIFLPNAIKQNTESKNYRKGYDLKVCYNIKLNSDKIQPKRVITKILKLDENNQFGFGMTKPFPTGCTKANSDISLKNLNDLIRTLDIDSTIEHLYVFDIEFDQKNATQNQITYNEIYPPIIKKQKVIDPCERSIYQLLEQHSTTEKGKPRLYKATKRAHATMFKNIFQPMYLEQIVFAAVRAGWKVTNIYLQYTFEQERFKRDFILMNHKSRQNAKNSVGKYFYKLMNNSNFGYDCRK